jgi:hypothetical protein
VFSVQAIASSSSCVTPLKSLPLGNYCRNKPLVFSLMPRCQGLVRIGDVDRHPGGGSQPLMRRHFSALIVCQRQTPLRLDPIEYMPESAQCCFGTGIVHSGQHREQGSARHQRSDGQVVLRPLDEIALSVPRHQAFLDLRRPVMNADHVRNPSPLVLARACGRRFTWPKRDQPITAVRNAPRGERRSRGRWFREKPTM